ncbi:hypothetical protein ES319_D13G111500v1 [Gossypium barbadense]|uniref:DUF7953 domain-containing protein n=3 Tax=Gossypium TaxID=3633 RepID=A0A5J5NK07_GOSBA|nr:hypothetical protein ES319_D13G111500v1 [Gossypium barbadense]PPD73167.1 hypothetical protein GOBAR_DD29910 [Gossypium barbadense]TYG37143.1 hypothetical protein ES288_D13G118400v1 [Gossypium darwinii]TYH34300.1 hypothetical protein ES332_D13G119000v1 [Gossypium tomentosum]
MSNPHLLNSRISFHFLVWWILFGCFPGLISSFEVTLDSIEIFRTHDWISKPTVYFECKGENTTLLPDVTKINVVYSFKGQESWQPLTQLDGKKCKRCGFYEKDVIKTDDVYAEWEFCATDFEAPAGKYILFKENQLNVTFHCQECPSLPGASNATPEKRNIEDEDDDDDDGKGLRIFIVLVITAVVSTVTIIGLVMANKHWQKKKRQQDQARFLKLFEEGDDIEDELGLGTVI